MSSTDEYPLRDKVGTFLEYGISKIKTRSCFKMLSGEFKPCASFIGGGEESLCFCDGIFIFKGILFCLVGTVVLGFVVGIHTLGIGGRMFLEAIVEGGGGVVIFKGGASCGFFCEGYC